MSKITKYKFVNKKACQTTGLAGADDGARTRYLHLGKVALYQMSYIRICESIIYKFLKFVKTKILLRHFLCDFKFFVSKCKCKRAF